MEVDDSVISTGIGDVDETSSSKENGGRLSRHTIQSTVQKDEVTVQPQEDPPRRNLVFDMEDEHNDVNETKIHMQSIKMSDTDLAEQEGSRANFTGKKKTSIASSNEKIDRNIAEKRPHPVNKALFDMMEDADELKPDEFLVGFDDNGEGVFIKDEDGSLTKRFREQEEAFEKSQNLTSAHETTEPLPKKFKKSPSLVRPAKGSPKTTLTNKSPVSAVTGWKSPAASPLQRKSPAKSPMHTVSQKSPPIAAANFRGPAKKSEKFISPKMHIVADSEETNGNLEEKAPSKSQAETALSGSDGKKALTNDYNLPFKYGWKRELVWRANLETSKDKADVYYITPSGKKLRTRSDIMQYLKDDLKMANFSFAKEPLGVGPEFETVRSAKAVNRLSTSLPTPVVPTVPMGKRISKPKGPKGASPPPQGWTPTSALKVNNLLLSGRQLPSVSNSRSTPASASKASKVKKVTSTTEATSKQPVGSNTMKAHEPCTMSCSRAPGQVPQLQCVKCLCLYHHECVGLNRKNSDYRLAGDAKLGDAKKRDYICEACKPSTAATGAGATTVTAVTPVAGTMKMPLQSSTPIAATAPARHAVSSKHQLMVKPMTKAHSLPAARTPTHAQVPKSHSSRPTQSIGVFKSKKYLMSHRPIPTSKVSSKDIMNDMKLINDTLQNKKKDVKSIRLDDGPKPGPTGYNDVQKLFCFNFFSNIASAYDVIVTIFKYLKIHERSRAASVCKLWNLVAKDTSLWRVVRMKNSKVCNWQVFAHTLRRGETKHLDLRKMLIQGGRSDEMWQDFCKHISLVDTLEVIDLCRCLARVVESLFQSNKNLRTINALTITGESLNLELVSNLKNLQELRLRMCDASSLSGNLEPLQALSQLKHLSLTGIRGLGTKSIEVLGELTELRSLELGECGDFDSTFAMAVLPKLSNLQRLRLENGQEVHCCTLEILEAAARLEQLTQLELLNFDIKPGFDEKLQLCTNIRKLLIIPTYISQSATTNHIMLSAVQQVADTLQVLTWGVTVELLRVTALYVDQCEEAKKKEEDDFNECIPVLKPVPGAPVHENDDDADGDADAENATCSKAEESDVPQIEILPLYKVESILHENLPKTRYTIVKLPYHATCKQQLVE